MEKFELDGIPWAPNPMRMVDMNGGHSSPVQLLLDYLRNCYTSMCPTRTCHHQQQRACDALLIVRTHQEPYNLVSEQPLAPYLPNATANKYTWLLTDPSSHPQNFSPPPVLVDLPL